MSNENDMRPDAPAVHPTQAAEIADGLRDANFCAVQRRLREALAEPETVPPALLRRIVRRCEAVLAGRAAEERLHRSETLPQDELCCLTAAGLLGRLAYGRKLPEEPELPVMAQQLSGSAWLRGRAGKTPQEALRCLREIMPMQPNESAAAAGRKEPPKPQGPVR